MVGVSSSSLLASIVTWVNVTRRTPPDDDAPRQPILPLFIVGFLAMVAVRSAEILDDRTIDVAKTVEGVLLTAALVGLGAGVQVSRIKALGPAPLLVGFLAWVLVAGVSLATTAALI